MITKFDEYILESVKNPTFVKSVIKKLVHDIKDITPSIKKGNITLEDYSKMWWSLEIRWLDKKAENRIEKLLKTRQKELLKSGLLIPYKISEHNVLDFIDNVDNEMGFDLVPSDKTEIWVNLYFKDLYTRRVNPPKYLYHATDPKNSPLIKKQGLQPIEFDKGNWTNESIRLYYPPTVFASYEKDNQYSKPIMINRKKTYMKDIWRIDTTGLKNTWWEDLNFYRHEDPDKPKPEYLMTFDPIPPSHLTLLK